MRLPRTDFEKRIVSELRQIEGALYDQGRAVDEEDAWKAGSEDAAIAAIGSTATRVAGSESDGLNLNKINDPVVSAIGGEVRNRRNPKRHHHSSSYLAEHPAHKQPDQSLVQNHSVHALHPHQPLHHSGGVRVEGNHADFDESDSERLHPVNRGGRSWEGDLLGEVGVESAGGSFAHTESDSRTSAKKEWIREVGSGDGKLSGAHDFESEVKLKRWTEDSEVVEPNSINKNANKSANGDVDSNSNVHGSNTKMDGWINSIQADEAIVDVTRKREIGVTSDSSSNLNGDASINDNGDNSNRNGNTAGEINSNNGNQIPRTESNIDTTAESDVDTTGDYTYPSRDPSRDAEEDQSTASGDAPLIPSADGRMSMTISPTAVDGDADGPMWGDEVGNLYQWN